LAPHKAFEGIELPREDAIRDFAIPTLKDEITDEETKRLTTLFEVLLAALPDLLAKLQTDFTPMPPLPVDADRCRADAAIEMCAKMHKALGLTELHPEFLSFVNSLVSVVQPYDAHVGSIFESSEFLPVDLVWQFMAPIPSEAFIAPAISHLPAIAKFVKRQTEAPADKIAVFLQIFACVTRSRDFDLVVEVAEHLVTVNKEAVVAIVFSDLARHCLANVELVSLILAKAEMRAPILDFLASAQRRDTRALMHCLAAHEGPIDKVEELAHLIDESAGEARRALWPLLIANGLTPEYALYEFNTTRHGLGRKAQLVAQLGTISEALGFLKISGLASPEALNAGFDVLSKSGDEQYTSEWYAEILLGAPSVRRQRYTGIQRDTEKQGFKNTQQELETMFGAAVRRRWLPGGYPKYLRFVRPILGEEKLRRFAVLITTPLKSKVRGLADVLADPGDEPFEAKFIDKVLAGLQLVEAGGLDYDKEAVRKIAECLGKEEIKQKLKYERVEELLQLAVALSSD
jgi:hypothetical protein